MNWCWQITGRWEAPAVARRRFFGYRHSSRVFNSTVLGLPSYTRYLPPTPRSDDQTPWKNRAGCQKTKHLSLEVIDQSGSDSLGTLLHNNVPDIPVLVVDNGEAPDLSCVPSVLEGLGVGLDDLVRLDGALGPSLLEESLIWVGVFKPRKLLPRCNTLDSAEDVVLMLVPSTFDNAMLAGSLDTSGTWLLNVDVGFAILLILLGNEGDSDHADCFADDPANALEG
jgi:hypothetical protein